MGMLRPVRAYTKRETIVRFVGSYHGHSEGFLIQAGSSVATLGPPVGAHWSREENGASHRVSHACLRPACCFSANLLWVVFKVKLYGTQVAAVKLSDCPIIFCGRRQLAGWSGGNILPPAEYFVRLRGFLAGLRRDVWSYFSEGRAKGGLSDKSGWFSIF